MKTLAFTNEQQKDLQLAIGYLIDSERKSYEEYVANEFKKLLDENQDDSLIFTPAFYNRSEINHVYAVACRVNDMLHPQ